MDDRFDQTIDLVRLAQDGDSQALDSLFERCYERVRRMVRLRLGAALRHRMDSGDVLQETFLEALLRNDAGSSWDTVARLTGRPSPDAARVAHKQIIVRLSQLMAGG